MSSLTFDGVWFLAYSADHSPAHVHGKYAETEVLVELTNNEIRIASRKDAIRPPNAKRSDVKKIMQVAATHGEELVALWEQVHGRV